MTMRRKIYNKLLNWKNSSNGNTAILIEGARRVGKTTVCKQFAKNEYDSYLFIDFSKRDPTIESYFINNLANIDDFFMLLSTYCGVQLKKRKSVIIFDEIQMFPQARAALKHLVEDGRYDYIETGSLISVRENVRGIVLPSEEISISMYPMDFEEFLWALGEEQIFDYTKQCWDNKVPLDQHLHSKSMLLFKQYMLVGGMPMSVKKFIEGSKDFVAADKEKRKILKLYKNDIMKINTPYKGKVLAIFNQIPGLLSSHEKRVVFNDIKKNSIASQYAETFFWLSDSMICNECIMCNDPNVGFALHANTTYIKCYMADTGLLLSHAFSENELLKSEIYAQILNDKLSVNKGMLYENIISQMLVAAGHDLYFYTHYSRSAHRNDIEIDFLISNKNKLNFKIFPIEVKSGKRYSVRSLQKFGEKYKDRISKKYVIHPKNFEIKDNIIFMPPYMTMFL